ncbi:MAG TPA: iron-sulfur cluster-binding domain-containing protein, partial [Chitinophagaceae bacterium]|nr:iron-sulfur cluster-binding domain-containing protein [Chitinophagaceae bacterium]
EELQLLQSQFRERFSIQWLFSSSPDLSGARLYRESLIHFVKYFSIATLSEMLFYVCGPLSYMRMCTFVLTEMGVPPDNIKRENFLIAQPRPSIAPPPEKQSHMAIIHFRGLQYKVPVHYPDSILQAARKQGIALPYSCETGRCANCVARRIKGDVWLSYNEVLTDTDLAKGLTLTCVGHPQGGNVELVIG